MTVGQVRLVLRKQADTLCKNVEANLQLKARYFTVTLVSVTSHTLHVQAVCIAVSQSVHVVNCYVR